MNQSTNYNFNLPEGTDLVNLLTQLIPNWANLDTLLKGVENQAITNCTEVVSLGVHAITRSNTDGKILKWISTANYTAGDTFTIDGNLVAAATASGEALATNAIVSGAVVLAALNADESAMTIFVTGTNVASDSAKLGGELPSYYAKESDMSNAQSDITDLDNLMGNTSISAIGDGTVTGALSSINTNLSNLTEKVSITADGVKTRVQILNSLYDLIDKTKITPRASLKITYSDHTEFWKVQEVYSDIVRCSKTKTYSNELDSYTLVIKTSNSEYNTVSVKTGSVTFSQAAGSVAETSGTIYDFYY